VVRKSHSGEGNRGAQTWLSRLASSGTSRPGLFSRMNLHGGPLAALYRWSGARWRVGFAHYRRGKLYNILIPDARTILNQPSLHTAEHQAAGLFFTSACPARITARPISPGSRSPRGGPQRAQPGIAAENLMRLSPRPLHTRPRMAGGRVSPRDRPYYWRIKPAVASIYSADRERPRCA